jgi:hypothetical protein
MKVTNRFRTITYACVLTHTRLEPKRQWHNDFSVVSRLAQGTPVEMQSYTLILYTPPRQLFVLNK